MDYIAPQIEIIEVEVEKGFALSNLSSNIDDWINEDIVGEIQE